jgi:hypothetical protein
VQITKGRLLQRSCRRLQARWLSGEGQNREGSKGNRFLPHLGQERRGDGRPWTVVELPLVTPSTAPWAGMTQGGDRRRAEMRDLRQLYGRQEVVAVGMRGEGMAAWRRGGGGVEARRRGGSRTGGRRFGGGGPRLRW